MNSTYGNIHEYEYEEDDEVTSPIPYEEEPEEEYYEEEPEDDYYYDEHDD